MKTHVIVIGAMVWWLAAGERGKVHGACLNAQGASARLVGAGMEELSGARLQTLLARSGFSPGLIDGKAGRKTRLAIEYLQRSRGLEATGTADEATWQVLNEFVPGVPVGTDQIGLLANIGWTRRYVVTQKDVDLITGALPEDWNERALMEVSGYTDVLDMLGERGWCSVELVRTLNPEMEFESIEAGQEVVLPNVDVKAMAKIGRVEIVLSEKLVLGYDGDDRLVMMTHCSIAAEIEKAPVGELHVKVVATEPDYTFNPESWPEVDNVFSKLRIAPGPRNPVGAAWIGLDRPGYGIHGTVRPQDIGKTGSHGCFRLTNWDALRLARAVSVGTWVEVME